MFVGRKTELGILERAYRQKSYQCCMVYGRRRIGKTRLINEFIKDKRHLFLVATNDTGSELLRLFSESILEQYPMESMPSFNAFDSWESLFDYVTLLARKEQLILAIDEFPYLAASVPPIPSKIQKYCDHEWKEASLYLILSGSSMSFMEKQILDYQSPLYGRRTLQIKLQPLPYYESIQFFPEWNVEERLYSYSICGGIPQYLERFSIYENLKEALVNELLTPSGALYGEPMALMNEELREPAVYVSIIRAIANGKNKLNEISSSVGKESSKLSPYIANLIGLGIIDKSYPIGSRKNHKRSIYFLKDNLFRFYYRFIGKYSWLIENNQPIIAYNAIEPYLGEYFGHVFEDICRQFLERKNFNGDLGTIYTESGTWWGTNSTEKKEEKIDIVLSSDSDVLVGECKWQNELVGESVLSTLKKRGVLIQGKRKIHYAIFSKSGFTGELKASPDIMLYTVNDIVGL